MHNVLENGAASIFRWRGEIVWWVLYKQLILSTAPKTEAISFYRAHQSSLTLSPTPAMETYIFCDMLWVSWPGIVDRVQNIMMPISMDCHQNLLKL
jgi:hypothetical protein